MNVRGNRRQKKKKHHFCGVVISLCLVHTDAVGILAGEQKALAISRKSAIKSNNTASAKQVRRAKEKGLISVFLEAMSHVASKMRRAYRAEIMRIPTKSASCLARR